MADRAPRRLGALFQGRRVYRTVSLGVSFFPDASPEPSNASRTRGFPSPQLPGPERRGTLRRAFGRRDGLSPSCASSSGACGHTGAIGWLIPGVRPALQHLPDPTRKGFASEHQFRRRSLEQIDEFISSPRFHVVPVPSPVHSELLQYRSRLHTHRTTLGPPT